MATQRTIEKRLICPACGKKGKRVGAVTLRVLLKDEYRDGAVLRVSEPGAKVKATVKRAGTFEEQTVTVTLGPSATAASNEQFRWQYAGVGQLDRAVAAAKKAGKPVLLGLSGAET